MRNSSAINAGHPQRPLRVVPRPHCLFGQPFAKVMLQMTPSNNRFFFVHFSFVRGTIPPHKQAWSTRDSPTPPILPLHFPEHRRYTKSMYVDYSPDKTREEKRRDLRDGWFDYSPPPRPWAHIRDDMVGIANHSSHSSPLETQTHRKQNTILTRLPMFPANKHPHGDSVLV